LKAERGKEATEGMFEAGGWFVKFKVGEKKTVSIT
jgi:hypothetical protein